VSDIEITTPPPTRPAAERVTEAASLPPKPHQHAERTAELDAAILRWRDEMPEDLARRVFARLEETETGCWEMTTASSYCPKPLPWSMQTEAWMCSKKKTVSGKRLKREAP
jgi:hypothetical protein